VVKEALIQELTDLISSYLSAQGLELIELINRPQGERVILTVLVDKPKGGIALQECVSVCHQLKILLEEKNIIEGDYVLEVSSPGLDRPLKKRSDFLRVLDKEAVFFLNDLVHGKCQWQGVVCKVDETNVFIQTPGGILEVPLTKINKAKLVVL
jgi:ribosome maturation factor RimP